MKLPTPIKLLAVLVLLTSCSVKKISRNPDFLWNTVNDECIPHQKNKSKPDPCTLVMFEKDGVHGYVAYKDIRGVLHYLLLPATKVTGIESPEILKTDSPNYFYHAWEVRTLMSQRAGKPVPDEEISLAINSQTKRSQNQLHIHISCTRPDVKELILKNENSVGANWAPFPVEILGHKVFARRLSAEQIQKQDAFKYLANDFTEAKDNMYQYGLAMVQIKNSKGGSDFILLTMLGHAEDIQDHSCPQVMTAK